MFSEKNSDHCDIYDESQMKAALLRSSGRIRRKITENIKFLAIVLLNTNSNTHKSEQHSLNCSNPHNEITVQKQYRYIDCYYPRLTWHHRKINQCKILDGKSLTIWFGTAGASRSSFPTPYSTDSSETKLHKYVTNWSFVRNEEPELCLCDRQTSSWRELLPTTGRIPRKDLRNS